MDETPESNPFIRFKQLVDRALGRPSPVSTPSYLTEEAQEKQRRWLGHLLPDRPELDTSSPEDVLRTAEYLLRLSWRRHKDTPAAKVDALYREDAPQSRDPFRDPFLAFGGAFYFLPETGDRFPTLKSLFSPPPPPSPRWLSVDWFKDSPYSPIELEADTPPPFGDRTAWRTAFEDLLADTLDKPRITTIQSGLRPYGSLQYAATAPGLDWMLSLQCRGLLPPQLPSYFGTQKCDAFYNACRRGLGPEPDLFEDLPNCDVRPDIAALAKEISKPAGPHSNVWMRERLRESPSDTVEEVYQRVSDQALEITADCRRTRDADPAMLRSPYERNADEPGASDSWYPEAYLIASQFWGELVAIAFQDDPLEPRPLDPRKEHTTGQAQTACDDGDDQDDEVDDDDDDSAASHEGLECPYLPPRSERMERLPNVEQESVPHSQALALAEMNEDEDEDEDEDQDGNPYVYACPYLPPRSERLEPLQPNEEAGHRVGSEDETEDEEEDYEEGDPSLSACPYLPPKSGRVEGPPQHYGKSSILSSLTVTEKTYHKDGTVTNKVLLRKRFSDGSEDSMESVHTSRAGRDQLENDADRGEDRSNQKSWTSWFW